MALTPSKMLPLGTVAPAFSLPDTDGKPVALEDFDAKAYLVVFMCNHCPYVKHLRKELAAVTADLMNRGVAVFGINSNDAKTYPDDSPAKMKEEKRTWGYRFPYLFDETQKVARAYDAACTPDFYLFDGNRKLVYRGQFDDSRPGNNVPITGKSLLTAAAAVLEGKPVSPEQKPSIGCNIKWR